MRRHRALEPDNPFSTKDFVNVWRGMMLAKLPLRRKIVLAAVPQVGERNFVSIYD